MRNPFTHTFKVGNLDLDRSAADPLRRQITPTNPTGDRMTLDPT
ncbi:hypothetical protein QP312_01485 [Pauljensenia sp. UMB8040A]|nr:hypothetical protein [Pauljensenia sp. UMB8040A]MDK6829828.1 hypothetical protein [Pauljensenia sp. UMB8040A]